MSRQELTLAAPFLLLLIASYISWPWRALEWPGTIGNLSPPSVVLMMATVYGAVLTMRGRLPLRLITWPPAGLGAVFFLTVGFGLGNLGSATIPAAPIGYVVIFGFVLLISIALAQHSTAYAVAFVCMFLMTQAVQIPIFEASEAVTTSWASALTATSAARAAVEVGVLIWLVRRLVLGPESSQNRWAIALVGLVLVHGLLAGWELPVRLRSEISVPAYGAEVTSWMFFVGLQLGVVTVVARLRRGWNQPPVPQPARAVSRPRRAVEQGDEPAPQRKPPGRPTPRSRRRRR